MPKFASGRSGNPGGRTKVPPEVRLLARAYTLAAIDTLATIMESGKSEQSQIMAANSLLDRAWGKPTQPISGDDHAPAIKFDPRADLLDAISSVVAAATKNSDSQETEADGS